MRRAAAVVLLVVLALTFVAPPAEACIECVALGLASFAVFNQLVGWLAGPRVVYVTPTPVAAVAWAPNTTVAWAQAGVPVTYAPAPSWAAPVATVPTTQVGQVAWNGQRVVQYPHGRYELRGDGMTVPWAWVWIPVAPPSLSTPGRPLYDGPEGSGASRSALTP